MHMRMLIKKLCAALFIVILLTIPCNAQAASDIENDAQSSVSDIENRYNFNLDDFSANGPADYINMAIGLISKELKMPLRLFFSILLLLLSSSLVRGLATGNSGNSTNNTQQTLDVVITAVFFIMLLSPVLSLEADIQVAVTGCKDFMESYIMIFTSLLVAGGQVGTAAVATGFFSASLFLICEIITTVILPLGGIYLGLCVSSLCVQTIDFYAIGKMIKSAAEYILLIVATIFGAIIGLQTLISGAADSLAIKTGKFLVGAGVPIIGHAVQEALNTVIGGISSLKTTAGVAIIIAVVVMFVVPITQCATYFVVFKISEGVAEILGSERISKLLSSAAQTVKIYLSSIILLCFLIILSIIIMINAGTG